jgi:hypothetical protein
LRSIEGQLFAIHREEALPKRDAKVLEKRMQAANNGKDSLYRAALLSDIENENEQGPEDHKSNNKDEQRHRDTQKRYDIGWNHIGHNVLLNASRNPSGSCLFRTAIIYDDGRNRA